MSNLYGKSRSIVDQYTAADPSYTASSNLYNYSAITDRGHYKDTVSTGLWSAPPAADGDVNADSLYAGYKRSTVEALYHQSLLGTHNTIGQSQAWYSTNPLVKRPRFQSSLPVYPQRPGEKDCAHYMLTRTCKFGDSCMFDHPMWVPEGGIPDWKEVLVSATSEDLPERPGAPDCPFYLKTRACRFGPRCRFNHPQDKVASLSAIENANGSELPERPSEPPCVFYMKTGICKFGPTCKFHHPKDITIRVAEMEGITAVPAMLHNSKGLPVRPGEADCPFYLKTGSCKYGATCRYNHPERYAIDPVGAIVANPAVHMNFSMVNPASSVLQTTLGLGSAMYPQRPGQMECDYYMKTGVCMFGERCKYHHPLDRTVHALSAKEGQQQNAKLTLAGLPRREGALNCPYYMKTGACKYGVTCRFDHPPPGEVMAAATSITTGEKVKDGSNGK